MIQPMTNRKQRRLQEKKAGKNKPPVNKKNEQRAALAAEKKAQGMALKNAGKEAEAIPLLREALSLDPSLADVHFTLAMMARLKPELGVDMEEVNKAVPEGDRKYLMGSYNAIIALMREKRQYKEAVICKEELCRLEPDNAALEMELGLIMNIAGRSNEAIVHMSRALNLNPNDKIIKGVYSTSLQGCAFNEFYPEVKTAIAECFKNLYDVHLRNFSMPWIAVLMKDPTFTAFRKAMVITDAKKFDEWANNLDNETGAFLKDPYFTGGLRLLIIADVLTEVVLTRLRRYLCLHLDELVANGRIALFETFIYALAEQCFFNEYIYVQGEDETKAAAALMARDDKIALGLAACYSPLYRAMPDKAELLHKLALEDKDFASAVRVQFDEPLEEEKIKPTIPVFGDFANEISRKVQQQYEENPYPRWTTIATTSLPNDDMLFEAEAKTLPFNILIAGCGTGRQAISVAVRYPKARITAIDLSRASLAYGIRKARECGMADRIKFVHADILSMKDWPEDFDMIECSGVLHHMEDPFLGWKTLNDKLKPNGLIKIGLYSETAREPIVEARKFIEEHGFQPTLEGIRACRQAIFALPVRNTMRMFVAGSADFYSASVARDLVFHVQEHRMTLPQIKGMMEKLGLKCVKFLPATPDAIYKYDKMFANEGSNRGNIDNWEILEQKHPRMFAGMYQFWCQKTAR